MKTVFLEELALENFMGIPKLSIQPDGSDLEILGANGTGKTTLLTAWLWLFADKNSFGKSKFDIKPRTPNVQHKQEPTVTAWIKVDGAEHKFQKSYEEVWKETRGGEKELKKNTKSYAINGAVIDKKRDYVEKVNEIFDPDKFLLLSDIWHFNRMKWRDRRKILMNSVENVSQADIEEEVPDIKSLALGDIEPSSKRDQLKNEAKDLKSERKKILNKIEALEEEIGTNVTQDMSELEEKRKKAKEEKKRLEDEIANLKISGQEAVLRERRSEVKDQLREIKDGWKSQLREKIDHKNETYDETQEELRDVKNNISDAEGEIKEDKQSIEDLEDEINSLKDEWKEIKSKSFKLSSESLRCSQCNQVLPEDKVEELDDNQINKPSPKEIDDKKKEFNKKNSQKLEENVDKGHEVRAKINSLKSDIRSKQEGMARSIDDKKSLEKKSKSLKSDLNSSRRKLKSNNDFKKQDDYQEAEKELLKIDKKLDGKKENPTEKIESKKEKLAAANKAIEEANEGLAALKNKEGTVKRVNELKEKGADLATSREGLLEKIDLVEKYTKTHAKLLEDKINDQFDIVNFNLFRPYTTKPGLKEVCETTVNGVSWDSTLNNGAKVKAGLDIIKTFSKKYNLEVPLFLDNAESITDLPEIDTQVIKLVVDENSEELNIKEV